MGAREARQKARAVALAARWEAAVARISSAHRAVELMQPDGYPSGGGEQVSGGGVGRPVEAAVLGREGLSDSRLRTEMVRDHETGQLVEVEVLHVRGLRSIDDALRAAEESIGALEVAASQMVAPLVEKDPPPRTNLTECEACGRTVAGTPEDRLRAGFCTSDYHRWLRAGRPDRTVFVRQRLREVSAEDHSRQFVLDRDTAGVDVWSHGVQVTLEGTLAAEFRALQHQHGSVPTEDVERLVQAAQEAAQGRIVSSLDRSVELLGGGS